MGIRLVGIPQNPRLASIKDVNGVSVTSTNGADTRDVAWMIVEPAA